MFEKQKQIQLSKSDFSKKGSIDEKIKYLVSKINSKREYYTTSSCSGRIMLLTEGRTKREARWIFVSHDKITFSQLKNALKKIPKQTVWFKFEPMILHVCCDSFYSAQKILEVARLSGFKHSGIISLGRRIVVEIRGTDFISAPVAFKGKIAISNNHFRELVKEANKKMKRNDKKIKKIMLCF